MGKQAHNGLAIHIYFAVSRIVGFSQSEHGSVVGKVDNGDGG
jgi:hypothetical protein